jgi:hypothetical protein
MDSLFAFECKRFRKTRQHLECHCEALFKHPALPVEVA